MAVPLKNKIMLKQIHVLWAQKLKIQWCSPEFFSPIFTEDSNKLRILWLQTSSFWVLRGLWNAILWYVLTPVYIWDLISQETKLNHERRSQGRQRKQQIIFNSFIINCQLDIDWTCTIARSTTLKNLASGILFPNCVNVSSCFLWKERLAYQWPLLTVAFN